jgi:hypothetical protein
MKPAILWMLVVACAKPAGGPLKYTFDATKLASVTLEAKLPVTQAQQAHEQAQAQQHKASEDYRDSEIELALAQYQAQNAIVVSALAITGKPAAATADTAALARRAADAKVAFAEARRAWLDKLASSTLYQVYAAQAKLELERGKLAQTNNLVPAGFDLAAYQTQAEERARAAATATAETDQVRTAAEAKLSAWSEAEKAFIKASGLDGRAESDRVAEDWKVETAAAPPPAAAVPAPAAPAPAAASPAAMPAQPPAPPQAP